MDNYDRERYQRARARVQQLRGLYIHAVVYVFVNLYLLAINLVTNAQSLWFYWPLLSWGVVLAAHGFIVLGAGGNVVTGWEERKIREFMERDGKGDEIARRS
ncbi:MAG: 2TM domain-containing protein [Ktedonobacterales bacterium]